MTCCKVTWDMNEAVSESYFACFHGQIRCAAVVGIIKAVSLQSNSPAAAQLHKAALHISAVAFIHRFGSSLNGHVHFHVCVVDGVFEQVTLCDWTTLEQPLMVDRSRCAAVDQKLEPISNRLQIRNLNRLRSARGGFVTHN